MSLPETVSIQIPTLNSGSTLRRCLESVKSQSRPGLEVLVIDGGSVDATVDIARAMGTTVVRCGDGLLLSRIEGILHSSADAIIFVDSDQVLIQGALERILSALRESAMAVLEESAGSTKSLLERMYAADRLVGQDARFAPDPERDSMMPRAFRGSLIRQAVRSIPRDQLKGVRYPDHALIHYECTRIASGTAFVPHALIHTENTSYGELLRKHYIYGRDSRQVSRCQRYSALIRGKARPRRLPTDRELRRAWLLAEVLLTLKLVPYLAGVLIGPRPLVTGPANPQL